MNIEYLDGWHGQEHDGLHPFRWMAGEARLRLPGVPPGRKYLRVTAGHSFGAEPLPVLRVDVNGIPAGRKEIALTFRSYLFPFDDGGDVEVELRLDRERRAAGDPRSLGVMVRSVDIVLPDELGDPVYGDGWYDLEPDEFFPYRWMADEAGIVVPAGALRDHAYITLPLFSEFMDMSQVLTVSRGGRLCARVALLHRWNHYSLPLNPDAPYEKVLDPAPLKASGPPAAPGDPRELTFSLNKLYPSKYHARDPRPLGLRVGPLEFHDDPGRHSAFLSYHANALLNYSEMIQGKTELKSYPLNLGIDLYGRCNIKPPCVYCLWDRMKVLEGEYAEVPVDKETLENYGPFFNSARTLVNCSFGEPLLHPRLGEILDFCAGHKKIVELSTNGQAFTERTIKALAGKPIYLYVSLDAATRETYAKIRNDRWDEIVPNLLRLDEERRKAGHLPKIFMVFMPMRVNMNDMEDYFRLCRRINADALVLRPLLHLWKPRIERDRGGYHFDYASEMLSREEAEAVIARAEEYSRTYGVPLANQYNFGTIREPGREEAREGKAKESALGPEEDRR